jgi:TPR repeat protein
MNQIEVVVSVLAAACLLALPASAKRGEQGGPTPLFPDDASARAGDLLSLAVAEMEGGRYDGAAAYLRRGASDGDLRCTYALGMLTLEGKGTQRDATLASDLLREAAMAGLPEAQTVLGLLYASGEGVEKDAVMAAEWYRKAARGGDPLGQAAYGAVLFLGVGVQMDRVRGYKWTILSTDREPEGAYSNPEAMEARLTPEERIRAYSMADGFTPRSMPEEGHREMERKARIFREEIKSRLRSCAHKSNCWK